MPELPEVETVCRGLQRIVKPGTTIRALHLRRADLRTPMPSDLPDVVVGRTCEGIQRRAKYLLWRCQGTTLINHLGMTGSWRLLQQGEQPGIHDHVLIQLQGERTLVFRDPRRFGIFDRCCPDEHGDPRLAQLGPEPLGASFDETYLVDQCRQRRAPVKGVLMDQRVVVGVGNIYAAEALFRAGIHPHRPARRIAAKRLRRLVETVRETLLEAIEAGGSTISDFRQAGGSGGYFQHRFQVYGRAGEPCVACRGTLRGAAIAGRSTVWCPRCQR